MKLHSLIIVILFSFSQHFIFAQKVIVGVPRNAILFKYAPNQIRIAIEGQSCEDIVVCSKQNKITRAEYIDSCEFYYWSSNCNQNIEIIYVGIRKDNEIRWVDTLVFNLKEDALHSIVAYIGDWSDAKELPKESLLMRNLENQFVNELNIYAPLVNWDIDITYSVKTFSLEIIRGINLIYSGKNILKKELPEKLVSIIQNSLSGDKFRFYNISISIGDCEEYISEREIVIK